MMKVGIKKGRNEKEAVLNCLNLIKNELEESLEKVSKIFIKVNLVAPFKCPQADTNVKIVAEVIKFLNKIGEFKITVGEACTLAFGNTMNAFKENGYFSLKKFKNVNLLDLNLTSVKKYFKGITLGGWAEFGIYYPDVDYIISIGKFKTHNHVVVTLSIKNMFGLVSQNHRHQMHGGFDPAFVQIDRETYHKGALCLNYNLIKLFKTIKVDLGVLEGFPAMEGNGPVSGNPIKLNTVMASLDLPSLDKEATKVMGIDFKKIPYINELAKEEYEVIGDKVSKKFELHKLVKYQFISEEEWDEYKRILRKN